MPIVEQCECGHAITAHKTKRWGPRHDYAELNSCTMCGCENMCNYRSLTMWIPSPEEALSIASNSWLRDTLEAKK